MRNNSPSQESVGSMTAIEPVDMSQSTPHAPVLVDNSIAGLGPFTPFSHSRNSTIDHRTSETKEHEQRYIMIQPS